MNKRVVITGATGFVGNALLRTMLLNPQYNVTAVARNITQLSCNSIQVPDLTKNTNWDRVFDDTVDTIIHCAARVHVMKETITDPLSEFRKINVEGTLKLAQEAAKNGVRRFIFISTIKVNGEETPKSQPFKASDTPNPTDPYGISKYEAEQALLHLAKETGLEVVIIRPVLIYGPNVKGNFNSLLKLASSNIPLPFNCIKNLRSMVYLDNLIDFILHSIHNDQVKNQILLVSDNDDLSLPALIKKIRMAQHKAPRLIPVPIFIFKILGLLLNKKPLINRLLGSLQVDISSEQKKLEWKPPYTTQQGIKNTVKHYMDRNN